MKSVALFVLFVIVPFIALAQPAPMPTPVPVTKAFDDMSLATLQAQMTAAKGTHSGLATLSVYPENNKLMTAGSFDSRVASPWDAKIGLNAADMKTLWDGTLVPGLEPRALSVIVTNDVPSFSVLLRKYDAAVEQSNFVWDLSTSDFNDYVRVAALNKFRIIDYATYMVGGIRKHAAVLEQDPRVSMLYSDFTLDSMNAKLQDMAKDGWYPTSLNISNTGPAMADNYSAVFSQQVEPTYAMFGLSKAQLQKQIAHYKTLKMSIVKIQGYSNGKQFAVIFAKDLPSPH